LFLFDVTCQGFALHAPEWHNRMASPWLKLDNLFNVAGAIAVAQDSSALSSEPDLVKEFLLMLSHFVSVMKTPLQRNVLFLALGSNHAITILSLKLDNFSC
jgi:hypothetical protein